MSENAASNTSPVLIGEVGLTTGEARKLLEQLGENSLKTKANLSAVKLFLKQFMSPLVLILLVAAAVTYTAGLSTDYYLILGILLLNAVLGFSQEYKAEKALEALKKVTVSKTRVIRDGIEQEVPNKDLVPGDLIVVAAGQAVPADAKILQEYSLEVNESALTGESLPVLKSGSDDTNRIAMGTMITSGTARAVVEFTGQASRFGQIAEKLSAVKDEPTPFERMVIRLSKVLGLIAIGAAALVYFVGVYKGLPGGEIFLVAASLAVAAVPEGLPAIVGLALALGVQRMARKRAIVRKMSAVEALGAVTVICTDKTGTLTSGQMKARLIQAEGKLINLNSFKSHHFHGAVREILEGSVLANNAGLILKDGANDYDIIGTPTDGALLIMAAKLGFYQQIKDSGKLIEEFPFDKKRKLISAVIKVHSETKALVRGAPELILACCRGLVSDGRVQKMSDEKRLELKSEIEGYAAKGYRVIGFASKPLSRPGDDFSRDEAETDLNYLGFVAITDPPRPEVRESLQRSRMAGVKTIMLTGDNLLTARAIGAEIGFLEENDETAEGLQIDALTDEELDRQISKIKIVARATPEQKLRIVQSLQRNKEVVAVTGDGINDSLALKQADVGVAMGITGTDVAKQAADIILTDDHYSTIVAAIEEGRRIDDSLSQVVRYLAAGNLSEVITIFAAVLLARGGVVPLLPVQILWVNIVTDALPAFALAANGTSAQAMRRAPKARDDHPLNKKGLKLVLTAAVVVSLFTLTAFGIMLPFGIDAARSAAFTVMIMAQMVLALVIAYFHSYTLSWKVNRYLYMAIGGTVLVQLLLFISPTLRDLFHLVLPQW